MSDADRSLKVLIDLGIQGREDAKAFKQLLDETKLSAEELAKQFGVINVSGADLQKILGEATEKMGEHGQKAEEAASLIEKLGLSEHELHGILHLIGHESGPAVGAVLSGIGAISGGGFAVGLMAAKELLEALRDVSDVPPPTDLAAGITALTDALAKGRDKINDYENAIGQIAQHEVTIAQALQAQLAYMQAVAAEREKVVKAQEDAAAAKRAEDVARGTITPEQKTVEEVVAKVKSAQDALRRQQSERNMEEANEQKAIEEMQQKQPEFDADAKAKRQKAALDRARLDQLQKEFDGKSPEEITQQQEELEKKANAARKLVEYYKPNSFNDLPDSTGRGLREQATDAARELEDYKLRARQYAAIGGGAAEKNVSAEEAAADEAEKRGTTNAQNAIDQQKDLDAKRRKEAENDPQEQSELAAQIAKIISEGMQEILKTPLGTDIAGESREAGKVLSGNVSQVSLAHQQLMIEIGSLIEGHAISLQEAAKQIQLANSSDQNFIQLMAQAEASRQAMIDLGGKAVQKLIQLNADIASLAQEIENIRAQQAGDHMNHQ